MTLLGAFFILGRLSWGEYTRHAATTRIRLVESLIFTDVIMGVTGLIGCGLMLNKKPLVIDTPLCDGLGVVMVATIFSQHLWTLSLAVATFMILVHVSFQLFVCHAPLLCVIIPCASPCPHRSKPSHHQPPLC